jgi:ketosteroid isomerase-like protein
MRGGDTDSVPERRPVDIIREVNEVWATRSFETTRQVLLQSEGWDDAVERFEQAGLPTDPIDPDVEVVVDAFPAGGTWIGQRGRDEWIAFWQAWVRPFRDFSLEHAYYEQIGDYVLAEVEVSARARDTGEWIEIPAVQVFKLRDGLICMYAVYPNRDDALAAIRDE